MRACIDTHGNVFFQKKIKKKIWNIRIIFITLQRQQEKKVFLVLFIKKKIKH